MRLFDPILKFLKQGMSPQGLALCVAIGIVIGNIPILGVSTLLCTVIALAFRLNFAAVQLVQAAMAPTQLLLIIPFVRLGEFLLHAPHQVLSIKEGLAIIQRGAGHAVVVLWDAILHAGFAWLLVAPPVTYLFYRVLTHVFTKVAGRLDGRETASAAPAQPPP